MTILRPFIPFRIFIIPVQSKQSAFDTFYFLLFFGWKNCPSSFSKKTEKHRNKQCCSPVGIVFANLLCILCWIYRKVIIFHLQPIPRQTLHFWHLTNGIQLRLTLFTSVHRKPMRFCWRKQAQLFRLLLLKNCFFFCLYEQITWMEKGKKYKQILML